MERCDPTHHDLTKGDCPFCEMEGGDEFPVGYIEAETGERANGCGTERKHRCLAMADSELATAISRVAELEGKVGALQSAVDDAVLMNTCGTHFMKCEPGFSALLGDKFCERLTLLISDAAKARIQERVQEIKEIRVQPW